MLNSFVKKTPAAVTVLSLVTGILISYYSKMDISGLNEYLFYVLLSGIAVAAVYLYKTITKGELFLSAYIFLVILFGIFSIQFRYYKTGADDVSKLADELHNKKITIEGVISEKPEVKVDRIRILIDCRKVGEAQCDGYVLASIYKYTYKDNALDCLQYGDHVRIEGKIEKLPHRRNPGEFDYGEYLKLHGIGAVFTASGFDKVEVTGHSEPDFFKSSVVIPVKNYSAETIDKFIGGQEGEYLKGLVLGERANISKETKENFVNAGVAHIIAVSGLNVAYVIIILWGILTFVPIRYSFKAAITILFLFFYMNLTGNTPSIIRATVMASVFLLAQVVERKPNPYNIISFAALIILIYDPRQLFDAGFILSFTAILSLIAVYPVIYRLLSSATWFKKLDTDKISGKAVRGVIILFLGTFAAQLGTLPITAVMFKKVSVVSLLANLFAIPFSNIALALGFVMIIASVFSAWIASVFAALNSFLLFVQLWFIEYCAKIDYAFVETYFVDVMMFVFYYAVLAMALTLNRKNLLPRLIIILILAANFFVWREASKITDKAQITFLDAGNSNSTFIEMPGGTDILINCGGSAINYSSAERNIIPYLKSRGTGEIDLLILNSLNVSEFRNLKYLVENFKINKIIMPVYYKPVFENNSISSFAARTKIDFITSHRVVNRQGNFRIYIYYDSLYAGESMLTELVYGNQKFVFNDSYTLDEDVINTDFLPVRNHTAVLKASGPGSFDFTSAEFITKLNPENIVIAQSKNRKRRINTDVFSFSLRANGFNVLNVSESGALVFETDGNRTERVDW